MFKKSLFYIFVFLLFSCIVYLSPSAWFIYFPKDYLYFLSLFSSLLQLFFYLYERKYKNTFFTISPDYFWIILLLGISFLGMILFPVRNLNLGDGILLLEHLTLEAKIFGYHLTMDEILEALIHSILYTKFESVFSNPMQVYRLVSTASGFFALCILYYYFKKLEITLPGYFLVLSSGGMSLFFGYSENYTMVTTVLWFYIFFVMNEIRENKKRNLKILIPISIIACVSILFHLVSGYLIVSLIFLCYHFSDKGKFLRNAFFSTLTSILVLAPVFLYFAFFSDVRFDFTQTHLTNPKFYPIKKMISMNHFRDILFCIIGSAFLPFVLLIYNISFKKVELKALLKKKEIQFLLTVLIGFSIHGFVHYPQLGFPADWDLLAFYWTPISFLSALLWVEIGKLNAGNEYKTRLIFPFKFVPIFLFSGFVFILNAIYLSKLDTSKFENLEQSLIRIEHFSKSEAANNLNSVKPAYKKFYLSVSFFLFESGEKLSELSLQVDSLKLLEENKQFELELNKNINSVESAWQKDFYARMTKYHLDYLKLLEQK